MLQVFHMHVASVCLKCFICSRCMLQSFLFWMLHMFSHICCKQYDLKCFSGFSLMLQQVVLCCKCYILDVSCVPHTCCKCILQIFHLFSDVCCIQMFFILQLFYVVRSGLNRGLANGGVVRARWGRARARPQPLIPAPDCRPRGEREKEREEGVKGRTSGHRNRVECARGAGEGG